MAVAIARPMAAMADEAIGMTKTVEKSDGDWLDRLLNKWPAVVDVEGIKTVAVAWGFKESGRWIWRPRLCGRVSLFYNAIFFVRLTWPAGIWIGIRWAGRDPAAREHVHAGIGWKLNGRIAIILRAQSDIRGSEGVSGPNVGQAYGWKFGTK